jgi:hypothetical protein
MRRMKEKQGKGQTRNDRSVNNGRVGLVETDLVGLVAYVALHFGDIRRDFHGDVGDGVDGGVRRVGQRGIGVRGGFIVETVCGRDWGNCRRVEHCARDKSRDNRGTKKRGMARRQGQRRIDFRWTGIRTGPSAFIGAEK